VRYEHHRPPPPSPEKNQWAFDIFDQAMGYTPDDEMFLPPKDVPFEGVAGITIKKKKRNRDTVSIENGCGPHRLT
jgi:hypothetical protein